jgi:hypothetical protein
MAADKKLTYSAKYKMNTKPALNRERIEIAIFPKTP